MINFTESIPKDPLVRTLVACYRTLQIDQGLRLTTIPNGRVDGWVLQKGGFEIFDKVDSQFHPATFGGFFPLTNNSTFVHIPQLVHCVNIQFHPHALSFPKLKILSGLNRCASFGEIFGSAPVEKLKKHLPQGNNNQVVDHIDQFLFDNILMDQSPNTWIREIVQSIERGVMGNLSIEKIAASRFVSQKTLERKFKSDVGLTPKQYYNILRFQRTMGSIKVRALEEKLSRVYVSTVEEGYYDLSHFIRECKRITGQTPRELFPKMGLSLTDVIIDVNAGAGQ